MRQRWFNYRPICLVFAFLLLGSLFSFYIVSNTILTTIISIIAFALLIFVAITRKKIKYLLVPLISFIVGVGFYFGALFIFHNTNYVTPNTIIARVYSINKEYDGYMTLKADACQFDGKNINSNLSIYYYDDSGLFENIEIGSVIEFKPTRVSKTDLLYFDLPNSRYYLDNIKYTATAYAEDTTSLRVDKTFAEIVKEKIKDNLHNGLTNENANIAYSSLFGESNTMSDEQYNIYKLSGIAHLIAVSGLNVGIIIAILHFILKLFKVNKWVNFIITTIFVFMYSYLCNFVFSIIRAAIMGLMFLLSDLLHEEYDGYTALAISGILIFIIDPFCIFDASFLLSFSCSFGIITLYKPIRNMLSKLNLPKAIAESMALTLASTISIVIIMAFYFHNINIISLLANLVIIPIFELVFTCTFVLSFLSLLAPFVTYLLYPMNYLLDFITILSACFAGLSFSNLYTQSFNYIMVVLYFLIMLLVSRMCVAKYQYKIAITLPMVAILIVFLL